MKIRLYCTNCSGGLIFELKNIRNKDWKDVERECPNCHETCVIEVMK